MTRRYGGYEKPPKVLTNKQVREQLEADVAKFKAKGGVITEHDSSANKGEAVTKLGIPGHHTKSSFNR